MRFSSCLPALLVLGCLPAVASGDRLPIVSEEDNPSRWVRTDPVGAAAWPATDAGLGGACVNLMFWIDAEGRTSNPVMLRARAPGLPGQGDGSPALEPFARSAALSLAQWQFAPAARNPKRRPVITNAVFVFARGADADPSALRQPCLVGNLRAFVDRKADEGYRRGNLNKGLIDRRREEFPYLIPDGCTRHAGWCD